MRGFLAVNRFLKGEKYDILHKYLITSAEKFGIELVKKTNEDLIFDSSGCDFVLFWDKDVNAARLIEKRGTKVFNSAEAIALCDDKAKTYIALKGAVKQCETIIAPMSFFFCDYGSFVDKSIDRLGLPLVFKECYGSFGEQVFLCNTKSEIMQKITDKPFLLQKYIAEANASDVRIEIAGGKFVAAMTRTNKNDFRSNITNGGTAVAYTPQQSEIDLALKACEVLGLTFGGVDILTHDTVCEVNSNAHIVNLRDVTGKDIAPFIFEAILKKL